MRRTSLTEQQAKNLAAILTARRTELGWSMRKLAAQTGFHGRTITELEAGANRSPQPDTLSTVARVLGLSISDLYVQIGWLPADELPTLVPYMRAKYHDLPEVAINEVEALITELRSKHRLTGPADGEDEHP